MADTILEIENLSKAFFGVHALNKVSLNVKRGEVHALARRKRRGKINAYEDSFPACIPGIPVIYTLTGKKLRAI